MTDRSSDLTREEIAEEIVDAILDRPDADPDDDLGRLVRRYLRADWAAIPPEALAGPGDGTLADRICAAVLEGGLWPVFDPSTPNGYRGGPFDLDARQFAEALARRLVVWDARS